MKDSRWDDRAFIEALRAMLGLAPLYSAEPETSYVVELSYTSRVNGNVQTPRRSGW